MVDLSYNLQNSLSLLVDMSKRVAFGGVTFYEFVQFMVYAVLGFTVLAMFISNVYRLWRVGVPAILDNWDGSPQEQGYQSNGVNFPNRMSVRDENAYLQSEYLKVRMK